MNPPDMLAQLRCVERELRYRTQVYPRRVAEGRMTQKKADYEIRAMQAVLETLRQHPEAAPRQGDMLP